MSGFKAILFEDPIPLLLLCALAEIAAVAALLRRRTRGAAVFAAVPLVVAASVAIAAACVTTEAEHLAAALDRLIAAIRDGDMTTVEDLIDDTYADGHNTKADVTAHIEQVRRSTGLADVRLAATEATLSGGTAIVTFRANIRVSTPYAVRETWPTRWRLWWTRRPKGWRVTSSRLDEPRGLSGAPAGP